MPRIARVVVEDIPHHITQRGNGRQQVFFEPQDYTLYQDLLRASSQQAGLRIWAYCLMPNHIHLIAVPQRPTSMADAMRRTNSDYARHYNLKHRSCGHVWQSRFYSAPLGSPHLWLAMAYVERNPVRAHFAAHAEDYLWSSAHLRLSATIKPTILDLSPWQAQYDWPRWQQALRTSIDEEAFGQRLQEASRRGRPLGDDQFIHRLENRCGRPLRALPVGRHKKSSNDEESQLALGHGV